MPDFYTQQILGLAEAKNMELKFLSDHGQPSYNDRDPQPKDSFYRRMLAWLGSQMVILGNNLQQRYSPSFCPQDLCATQKYQG